MISVFADSSYYVALLRESDLAHVRAMELFPQLLQQNVQVFTTAWVLTEVANLFSAPVLRPKFLSLLDDVETNTNVVIIPPEPEIFLLGIELYRSRADKAWSLTDCISFVVMNREGITEALTADHHFEQAGFKALIR